MSNGYSGPYCNVTLATGQVHCVQGNRAQVTGQLRDHEGGLAVLVGIYGDAIPIGIAHVASVEQMPGDWSIAD